MITRALVVAASISIASCASFSKPDCDCPRDKKIASEAPGLSDQRKILAEGYSMLYKDSFTISTVRALLYVKKESDDFDDYVTTVSKYGGDLHDELERLAKDYPGVRIDLKPLPEMEVRKRTATGWDKFKDIAPLTGEKGRAWERTLLISLVNGLNQERHLCEEMAKEEPNAQLRKVMSDHQAAMTRLWERGERLLEKRYYK